MLLFFLHKQYKEVDRSERGLCEKIIKSFRECQESIAQHCQHRGVLQAIIRWHGGGRYVWQLIPAWSPAEKQRAAFTRYQAKWGNKGTGVKLFQCLFSQGASFGEELLSFSAPAWDIWPAFVIPTILLALGCRPPCGLGDETPFLRSLRVQHAPHSCTVFRSRKFELISGRASWLLIRRPFPRSSGKSRRVSP